MEAPEAGDDTMELIQKTRGRALKGDPKNPFADGVAAVEFCDGDLYTAYNMIDEQSERQAREPINTLSSLNPSA